MAIGGADLVTGAAQIIAEGLHDILFDFCLAVTRPSQEDRRSRGLSSLDALGMVVGDLSDSFAARRTLSRSWKSHAAEDTRMAEPLPQLL